MRFALHMVGNREDAEEVAQDVILKVYRKIEAAERQALIPPRRE